MISESRNLLLVTCCKHVKLHLAHRDELKLCSEILTEIITYLFNQKQLQSEGKVNNCIILDTEILCLHILDPLVQTLIVIMDCHSPVLVSETDFEKEDDTTISLAFIVPHRCKSSGVIFFFFKGCLVTCLLGILQLIDDYIYDKLWQEYDERRSLKELLLNIFSVFLELINITVFPSDWLIMKMVASKIILNSLEELVQPMRTRFLKTQQTGITVSYSRKWSGFKIRSQLFYMSFAFFIISDLDDLFQIGRFLLNSAMFAAGKI